MVYVSCTVSGSRESVLQQINSVRWVLDSLEEFKDNYMAEVNKCKAAHTFPYDRYFPHVIVLGL